MFGTDQSSKKLLIVETDAEKRHLLSTFFSKQYDCVAADSVHAALDLAGRSHFGVLLAAIHQPDLTPQAIVPHLHTISPRTIPIFMSEEGSNGNTVSAFRAGAFEVVQAPIALKAVELAVAKAFSQFDLHNLKENYQQHLEDLVAERTAELDKALEEIENSYRMTLKALVQALETRDFETAGHSERAVTFSLRLGHEVGLSREAMRDLELGALLHDVGKIGVPDSILHKPSDLDEIEWAKMRLHPLHGQEILRNIPFLRGAARIVSQHHEKWDGSGYPKALRGEGIDIGARIFAVIDAFDAMISERVFRDSRTYEEARAEIEKGSGSQFDPMVVEAFKNVPKEDWDILLERSLMEKEKSVSPQAVVASLVYTEKQLEMVH
ncbi:MAG: HD domain-containing phosphohydrolase, partial [Acidobacteriota bacterium]